MSAGSESELQKLRTDGKMSEHLFQLAGSGDVERLTAILKGSVDVNSKNDRGWTALMFAARNGHVSAVEALLQHGCNVNTLNSTGQTALDIANFWNNTAASEALSKISKEHEQPEKAINFFGHNAIDRTADKRKDKQWIEQTMALPNTQYVLMADLQPVSVPLEKDERNSAAVRQKLLCLAHEDIVKHLESNPTVIFLGLDSLSEDRKDEDRRAWFAVDVSSLSLDDLQRYNDKAELMNPFPGMMQLSESDAAIAAQARAMLAWHDRYRFCPTCGSHTLVEEAGYKRNCADEKCKSLQGVHNTSYPRVDPVVIMAVVSPDGKKLLLGRQKRFPPGMWSCLAGFVEPGETIEDACRREVLEESGIEVSRVEYHSCQPWPMPSSLMIGCLAYATSTHIQADRDELEDCQWFPRQDVIHMLTKQHKKRLFCPPEQAIAHQLIKAYVTGSSHL